MLFGFRTTHFSSCYTACGLRLSCRRHLALLRQNCDSFGLQRVLSSNYFRARSQFFELKRATPRMLQIDEIRRFSSSFFFQIQYAARQSYRAFTKLLAQRWQSPLFVSMPQSPPLKAKPYEKRVSAQVYFFCLQRKMPISLQVKLIWLRSSSSWVRSSRCLLASYRSASACSYYQRFLWRYALRMRNCVWKGWISRPRLTFSRHLSSLPSIRWYFAYRQSFSNQGLIICRKATTSGLVLSNLKAAQNSSYPLGISSRLQRIIALSTSRSASFQSSMMQLSTSESANCLWLTSKQARQLSRQSATVRFSSNFLSMRLWKVGQRLMKLSNSESASMFLVEPNANSCSPWTLLRNFTFYWAVLLVTSWLALRQKRMALAASQFFSYISANSSVNWASSLRKSTL